MVSFQHEEHIAKSAIIENNSLTIGEQKNAIENFYNLLLTEFRHQCSKILYICKNKVS